MRSLEFDPAALEDLAWWVGHDRKKAVRILRLIQETLGDPFGGIGKPEFACLRVVSSTDSQHMRETGKSLPPSGTGCR